MAKNDLTNGTDAFDARLGVLQRSGKQQDIDAAKAVYERVRTARAIAKSYLVDVSTPRAEPSPDVVVALTLELGREERSGRHETQGPNSEE